MFLERIQDLSIFFWLQDDVFSSFPSINVVDGYPEEELVLPVVAVVNDPIALEPFELGDRKGLRIRRWSLEVYAQNKAQRDEISSIILDEIENGIPVKDFNEGFPPAVSPTEIGLLHPFGIISIPMRIFPELVERLYWKVIIQFSTEYNVF